MEVREAAAAARSAIEQAFADEQIQDVGLEEFSYDDAYGEWRITIGFRRPWRAMTEAKPSLRYLRPDRSYKLVRVRDRDGSIRSVTDRMLTPVE